MRLREFAPSPDRDHNDDVPDPIFVLANRWWNATDRQPQIEHVLNSLGWSIHQVESEDDAVQLQHRDGTTHFISADDFDPDLFESTKTASAEQVWNYVDQIHPDDQKGGGFLKKLILRNPQYELKRVPLSSIHIPDQEYDDEEQDPEADPYNRVQTVDPDHAGEYSANFVDRRPIVVDANGYILDGNHRAWAAANLLNKLDIMAWVPVEELNEIARIPQSELGGWGDKDTLEPMTTPPKGRKPVPGGSGYTYAVNRGDPEFMEIMIFDGDTLAAELDLFATLDPLKTWRVETVITDPDYRGQGLGKALYGIALTILKLTIEAGETQTKFGQSMWLMLDSIPGVEVLGYAMESTDRYRARPGDQIVDQNKVWTRYTFPVEPGRRSMRSTRRGTGIYSSQYVSMIARWTGR